MLGIVSGLPIARDFHRIAKMRIREFHRIAKMEKWVNTGLDGFIWV
jgi:hypothetical protein